MEVIMGKRCFNFLPEAKQIAKQLIIHRLWNGLTQEKVAASLGVTFQQYQKLEKCENRVLAEQLLKLCDTYNWDPRTILKADPIKTLDAWSKRRKAKTRPNVNNSVQNIHKKLDRLEDIAYRWYFKNNKKPLILTKEMEV
tara:strand:+ start:41 stop:460 length:420 start_codon:yes stop_codon:yes gene_type:complete